MWDAKEKSFRMPSDCELKEGEGELNLEETGRKTIGEFSERNTPVIYQRGRKIKHLQSPPDRV